MIRAVMIGFAAIAGLLILVTVVPLLYIRSTYTPGADQVLNFIKNNPDKASITWYRNDTLMISQHSDRKMPIASVLKIIIAIEYAHQAAAGTIDPDRMIAVDDLEVYHVKHTDGGAHSRWLSAANSRIKDSKVAIRDIAKGMITYSSNANTEWLCAELGLDKGDHSRNLQKVWSDRLPNSTTAAYASVMKKLNSKTDFAPTVYTYLDEVMEDVMENPRNVQWLKHSGSKGGSTAWVLAKAIYATDKKGNTTELVYFFNNLTRLQSKAIRASLNEFNLKILNDEEFRNEVIDSFKAKKN